MRLTRPPITMIQLVGISCLRLAMQQAVAIGERGSPMATSLLAASRFSNMCGGAYGDGDVERMTQLLETALMQGRLGVPPPQQQQLQAAAPGGEPLAS
ncbi:hypothetical protein HYH03_008503 [Edaphochlamys debaryana]|uniref:Uncharacterized protein n=1 Tax=Edaphochlamys debaryana TaxID=47281 RepID=A0A835Y3C4_9CHLO|nr:hypothetical protein HYH03_008503 [Edaphochlamys debaryana]|eukprot:KAG2493371.1 hypothetical protein HYH03_008503 [Edaphochlamys debaryana]